MYSSSYPKYSEMASNDLSSEAVSPSPVESMIPCFEYVLEAVIGYSLKSVSIHLGLMLLRN